MIPPKLSSHTHSIQFKRDSNAHRWWLGGGWRQQRRSSGVTRGRHARGEATPGHGRRRRHARRRTEVGVPCAPGSAHQSQLSGERRCEHGLQAKAIVAASMRLHGIMRLGVVHTRDAWCIVHRRASIRLHDAWCMVHGAWCIVHRRASIRLHDAWCMVHGAWCMVHGPEQCMRTGAPGGHARKVGLAGSGPAPLASCSHAGMLRSGGGGPGGGPPGTPGGGPRGSTPPAQSIPGQRESSGSWCCLLKAWR
jgi:hypothetical protein